MAQNNFQTSGVRDFATASNWSLSHVPTISEDAWINSAVIVTSMASENVNSIGTGTNSTNKLEISNNSIFFVADGTAANANSGALTVFQATLKLAGGTFDNPGTLALMGDNATDLATLLISAGSVTLDGGGTLKMSVGGGPTANSIIGKNLLGDTNFTNVDNTISGDGTIGGGLIFTNDSVIETNNNTSSSGGTLVIQGSAGNFNGNIGEFVNNGTVQADNDGTLIFGIDGIASTIHNDGTINLIYSSGGSTELKIASGGVTLQGDSQTGVVNLEGSNPQFGNEIVSDGSSTTLTLIEQTIEGAGVIGDGLLNLNIMSGSTIDANTNLGALYIGYFDIGPTIANGGTIEATSGGTLFIEQNIDNTGTLVASGGGGLTIFSEISGSGAVDVGAGGYLEIGTPGQVDGNVTFTGAGVLAIGNSAANGGIGGEIVGAVVGDQIDLTTYIAPYSASNHLAWQQTDANDGVLSLVNSTGTTLGSLKFAGSYTIADFSMSADDLFPPDQGTLVTIVSPTIVWANAVSGNFAAAANWNPANVPGATNDVLITAGGSYTVTSAASETVDSLTVGAGPALAITGGTFAVTDTFQSSAVSGTVTVGSGATFVLDGNASNSGALQAAGGTIDIAGALGGTGGIDIGQNGTVDLVSGSIAGNITFTGGNAKLILQDDGIGGQILGAAATDSIDASFVSFVAGEHAVWQQTSGSGGTLSLYSKGVDLASFSLTGQYNSLDFSLGNDGSGGTLITEQNTPVYPQNPGNNDEWILSDGNWVESADPGSHPAGYNVAGIGDWTGGGTDGILWFNPTNGDTDEWQLSNTQWAGSVDLGSHPGNFQIAGVGDFNGDGTSDVLWTSASGGSVQTDIWELSASGQWANSVSPGPHPGGYNVAAVGDWTGNGTDGILWYNPSTGDTDEWQLSGGQWSASVDLGSHPGSGWTVAGVGDFFNNGRDDVLWTNASGGSVQTDIWELDSNGQWMASVSPGSHPAGYQVAGIGDFTGTGTSDILWHNASTGDTDEWLINNGQWAGSIDLGSHPGSAQIAGTGDFNGAGNAAILWHG